MTTTASQVRSTTVSLRVLDAQATRSSADRASDGAVRLVDTYGRRIGYLRLSLTKACAMRCVYCRPAKLLAAKDEQQLSPHEIEQLVRHLAEHHGLAKVRLTGGDPTSRGDLLEIIERVASVPGIDDLAMTTNGLTLAHRARQYADAGIGRVNISLDSLNAASFAEMTGVDGLSRVLEGIDAAIDAGLRPIKLNSVVIRNQNDVELSTLVRYAADRQLEIRFIELMPMGPLASMWSQRYVSEAQMRRQLEPIVERWEPLPQHHDSARRYRIQLDTGQMATVGFITPMSCNFCAACNRIRIAADGAFYPCLMDRPRGTILPAIRPAFDGQKLDRLMFGGLQDKRAEHPTIGYGTMTHIGG